MNNLSEIKNATDDQIYFYLSDVTTEAFRSQVKALQDKLDNLFRESMKIATKAEDLNKLQDIYFNE